MNEQITIKELFSLDKTIATGIFEGAVYPWEVLSKIGDYIVGLNLCFGCIQHKKTYYINKYKGKYKCHSPWSSFIPDYFITWHNSSLNH